MTNTNIEIIENGHPCGMSSGTSWLIKRAGATIGHVNTCFEWFMAHPASAPGAYVKCDSLDDAAAVLDAMAL